MKHSEIGASSSNRWLNCPASVSLSKDIKQEDNEYARQGTIAHQLAEFAIKNKISPRNITEITYENNKQIIDQDMQEAVEIYYDYIISKIDNGYMVKLEERINLDFIDQEMFGTADATIYNEKDKSLEIVDYKHGINIDVEIKDNSQLIYYLLGAFYKINSNKKKIR